MGMHCGKQAPVRRDVRTRSLNGEFRRLMILIYDTETTGLPRDWNAPISDSDNWPRLVQLAWQLHDEAGKLLSRGNTTS